MKILSFGEIIWDVFPDKKCIGGAPFNFAAHAVKQGAEAFLVSAVGEDGLGKTALEKVEKYGIRADYVTKNAKATGACRVSLDGNGTPSYNLLSDVAYDYISTQSVSGEFDALYFGTLALRGKHNREQIAGILRSCKFTQVFCDVNIRPPFFDAESVKLCCESATVIKISSEELPIVQALLYEDKGFDESELMKRLANDFANLKLIIITKGDKGSVVYETGVEKTYFLPIKPVSVVSAVGAGDSYSAAFLVEYLKGADVMECMKKASAVSAKVVQKKGAI